MNGITKSSGIKTFFIFKELKLFPLSNTMVQMFSGFWLAITARFPGFRILLVWIYLASLVFVPTAVLFICTCGLQVWEKMGPKSRVALISYRPLCRNKQFFFCVG